MRGEKGRLRSWFYSDWFLYEYVGDKVWERKVFGDMLGKGALIFWFTWKVRIEIKSFDFIEKGDGFGLCIK